MYKLSVLLACLTVFVAVSIVLAQTPAAPIFAITNVTVIDVQNGGRTVDQTLVVTGNRITAVGPATQIVSPAGARVVDGRGKFLIPGLWDMHVHSLEHLGIDYGYGMEPYKLYIANGVTGVRDMGSSFIQFVVGKRRIESQQLVAPRIVAAGPLLEGGKPDLNRAIISKYVPTPEAGRLAVDALAESGVDFLKVHNGLTRDTYLAIADEAKRKNMVFAGHVPEDVTAVEASNAGQRSIEHLAPLMPVCADPASLRAVRDNPNEPIVMTREKCEEALRQIARNGTWLTPTIISGFPQTAANSPDVESQRRYLKPDRRATCPPLPAQERPGARVRHELDLKITKLAFDAGVRMLAGTDTTTCRQPGFAVIQEITLFVDAGLSPLEALKTATVNPAVFFNLSDSMGTIARGKLADMVLLDADPLMDIQNIKRVSAVVANGRLFDTPALTKLLTDLLASASGSSN
jgi:imidazolonepropionase-like amidohydrolase